MAWGKPSSASYVTKLMALFSLLLAAALLSASSCGPPPPPERPVKTPSRVITEDGIQFFVWGLKLPGTNQELKLKAGGSTIWLPLSAIGVITFTGSEENGYRPAAIVLNSGEKVTGDLFVDQIIEGTTDLGYWNVRLLKVRQVGMGED